MLIGEEWPPMIIRFCLFGVVGDPLFWDQNVRRGGEHVCARSFSFPQRHACTTMWEHRTALMVAICYGYYALMAAACCYFTSNQSAYGFIEVIHNVHGRMVSFTR